MVSGPVLRSLSSRAGPAPDIPIQSCSHLVYQCVRIWIKMRSHREPRVAPTTSISLRLSAPCRPIYVVLGKKTRKIFQKKFSIDFKSYLLENTNPEVSYVRREQRKKSSGTIKTITSLFKNLEIATNTCKELILINCHNFVQILRAGFYFCDIHFNVLVLLI